MYPQQGPNGPGPGGYGFDASQLPPGASQQQLHMPMQALQQQAQQAHAYMQPPPQPFEGQQQEPPHAPSGSGSRSGSQSGASNSGSLSSGVERSAHGYVCPNCGKAFARGESASREARWARGPRVMAGIP